LSLFFSLDFMEKVDRRTITSHFNNMTATSITQSFQPPNVIQGDYNKTVLNTRQLCGTNSKIWSAENVISSAGNVTVLDGVVDEGSIYTFETKDPSIQTFITSPPTTNSDFIRVQQFINTTSLLRFIYVHNLSINTSSLFVSPAICKSMCQSLSVQQCIYQHERLHSLLYH